MSVQYYFPWNDTTLIGIAADLGKLSLDDTLLSFFPDRDMANPFESNPTLVSVRLDFDDPTGAEAIFQLEVANEEDPRVIGVGLDGVYRSSLAGRPIIARGFWSDEDTFVIDYNEGPGIAVYKFRLHFDGDEVVFEGLGGSLKGTRK